MAELSQRAFALLIGVTHRAVQKAIQTGRITVTENGKIDPETAVTQWRRNTDEAKKSLEDLTRFPAKKPVIADANDAGAQFDTTGADADDELDDEAMASADESDQSLADYRASRAAKERVRYETEALALEVRRGNVIELSLASRLSFTAFRTIRDAVMNVPVRVKDQVAAEIDPARVEEMLQTELTSALEAIDLGALLVDEGTPDDQEDG